MYKKRMTPALIKLILGIIAAVFAVLIIRSAILTLQAGGDLLKHIIWIVITSLAAIILISVGASHSSVF